MTFTYDARGLTRGDEAPPGFRVVRHRVAVGRGEPDFEALAAAILGWELHRAAGLRVEAETPVAARGVRVTPRFGLFRLPAPCEVVWAERTPSRAGFAYGTLAGHPESGEESFLAVLDDDGTVHFELFAFSRPALWWSKLGGPLATVYQRVITRRYLSAAQSAWQGAGRGPEPGMRRGH